MQALARLAAAHEDRRQPVAALTLRREERGRIRTVAMERQLDRRYVVGEEGRERELRGDEQQVGGVVLGLLPREHPGRERVRVAGGLRDADRLALARDRLEGIARVRVRHLACGRDAQLPRAPQRREAARRPAVDEVDLPRKFLEEPRAAPVVPCVGAPDAERPVRDAPPADAERLDHPRRARKLARQRRANDRDVEALADRAGRLVVRRRADSRPSEGVREAVQKPHEPKDRTDGPRRRSPFGRS